MTKEDFLKQLGSSIAKHRLSKKLTQTEVAYRCDMERGNLTRIEKGKANITAETLLKISEAIDVPVAKFFAFQTRGKYRVISIEKVENPNHREDFNDLLKAAVEGRKLHKASRGT